VKYKNNLKLLINDLSKQKKIYRPTVFWADLVTKFFQIFKNGKLEKFRKNELALNFFVPTYNYYREKNINKIISLINKGKFDKRIKFFFKSHISGEKDALSDYRVFKASDDAKKLPYYHNFSEKKIGNPIEFFKFDGKNYTRSSLNYLLGLSFLKKITKNFVPKTVLEIGGGFGILGSILHSSGIKKIKYINIDLPPMSLFTEYYLSSCHGSSNVSGYQNTKKMQKIYINKLKKFSALNSWQIEKLFGKVDLFVNFVSFQEMEPEVLANYAKIISKLRPKFILLRNLKEGKQLKKDIKSVGVKKQIKFKNYLNIWKKFNYNLVAKNVIPFGYKTWDNYNSEILIFKRN